MVKHRIAVLCMGEREREMDELIRCFSFGSELVALTMSLKRFSSIRIYAQESGHKSRSSSLAAAATSSATSLIIFTRASPAVFVKRRERLAF